MKVSAVTVCVYESRQSGLGRVVFISLSFPAKAEIGVLQRV